MGNVVSLSKPDPMVWVCNCGCTTFLLLSDGTATCAACDSLTDGLGAGWLEAKEDRRTETVAHETFADIQGNGSVEFARRRVAKMAMEETASLLIVARKDGSISAWYEAETEDQVEWVKARADQAVALIARRFENGGQ